MTFAVAYPPIQHRTASTKIFFVFFSSFCWSSYGKFGAKIWSKSKQHEHGAKAFEQRVGHGSLGGLVRWLLLSSSHVTRMEEIYRPFWLFHPGMFRRPVPSRFAQPGHGWMGPSLSKTDGRGPTRRQDSPASWEATNDGDIETFIDMSTAFSSSQGMRSLFSGQPGCRRRRREP
ncbi:hypothetical protein VTJ04DRAFT_2957 [Mycothermus thermophilus]|uniref:uncharacterized protein n=1 Tax=Humicola insolens TaxID=85995 RepID=UPI0037436ED6